MFGETSETKSNDVYSDAGRGAHSGSKQHNENSRMDLAIYAADGAGFLCSTSWNIACPGLMSYILPPKADFGAETRLQLPQLKSQNWRRTNFPLCYTSAAISRAT